MKRRTRRQILPVGLGLLMLGARPHLSIAGSYGDFFLYIQLDRGDAVRRLLKAGFDTNARNEQGQHGLYLALREESWQAVPPFLEAADLDADAVNKANETLLMMAALKQHLPTMKALLDKGAAVNRPGWTPLHYAASGGSIPAIDLLLAHGALMEAAAPNGNTPLMMAARYGGIDCTEHLVKCGARISARNLAGQTAVDFARSGGFDGLADRLQALIKPA